ncbi:5-methyltetrahydropteroyltriglutamate--homocysteine methyltransferase [Paraphysoderma sedebokerense]|nr:5-methyltetrahydropteroyltriglutamate--homocysteine methyltransferase [Paraphysoderma sedebokerense]
MVIATNLGFPRIGAKRELKRLVENFWNGKLDQKALLLGAKNIRAENWQLQKSLGLDHIPSNDFSFYDHVLDTAIAFNVIPEKYRSIEPEPGLTTYFACARGLQLNPGNTSPANTSCCGPNSGSANIDVPAMEMKKYFDTNYHYIVPQFDETTVFKLINTKAVDEFLEAKALGIHTRPVIIGPISFLLMGRASKSASPTFNPLSLLPSLIPVYKTLLAKLADAGATWIQMDEPSLVQELPIAVQSALKDAYTAFSGVNSNLKFLLTTYFDRLDSNMDWVLPLPIQGIHIDLVRAPNQLDDILPRLPSHMILSLGLVNGRNVWKTDLEGALSVIEKVTDIIGSDKVFIAPSCSLLHSPVTLDNETKMDPEILNWLAFAKEKIQEIIVLKKAANGNVEAVNAELDANKAAMISRRSSTRIHSSAVQDRIQKINADMMKRQSPFKARWALQQQHLQLPLFPTTTIGSFPQTKTVRQVRAQLKKNEISQEQYWQFIKDETVACIRAQEELGLDVLVHGEFERNDMVEYFGENLSGYVFSSNGWVQSYGSRCVKPPIIFGDVSRPKPMTVETSVFAQSVTTKPMKGMLTGPITMLQWSFVRDDQPRSETAFQLALAIRDEVRDLELAGIKVIQIDEAALREGLPLRRADWEGYLKWAIDAFLLSSTGVKDETQIHSHMCYSDFNDIFPAIQRMDCDALTIENSKSDLKLLNAFEQYHYVNGIGPGVYDIHSPRIPSVEELKARVDQLLKYLDVKLLWINPDCGLKTRNWPETKESLRNMVEVAKMLRTMYK